MNEQLNSHAVQHEPTWGQALAIWRWIARRSLIVSVIGGFVVGLVFGLLAEALGLDTSLISAVGSLIGGLVGLVVTIYFFKKVIGKRFGRYKLVLVPIDRE